MYFIEVLDNADQTPFCLKLHQTNIERFYANKPRVNEKF